MSGVCGLVIPGASQVDSIADTMLARLAHYPWHVKATSANTDGSAALGAAVLDWRGPVVVSDPTGRWTLALDGELFETGAELARLRTAGFEWATGSDAALLLAGWMHEGPAFLARLNGEFSAIGWDAERRELHGITDRFGLRPLYVATPRGACAFATEITALLAVPGVDRGWSHEGVSQFFAFGHFFGDETLLSGARAVPAASCATFRAADGVYTSHPYWRLTPGSVRGSADDLSREFDDRFVRAVERRARPGEHLGLSLSGGLDARTILGVMPPDRDLKTVSLGIEGSLDHKSAAELAALAGVDHHAFTLGRDFLAQFERHLREMISLTDGHYLDQGIVMPTMPLYRDLKIEHLMRGHGGELLHMTKAYAFSLDTVALSASAPALDGWLFDHLTGYMLGGVPADLFTIDLRAGARASLARALERCVPTDRPVDRVWQLFLNERLHRETALSMHMFGSFAGIRQPYLDNDVIDVLFSMPAALKLGDELQTRLLRHRRPAFLDVTNSNTGARMGAGRLETAFAKLRLKVGAKLGWKGYQPYERLGLWLKQELRPLVEATVTGDRLLSSGLFRPDAVRRIVQQHVEGQANHTFLLMSLAIFALGMEWREKPDPTGTR